MKGTFEMEIVSNADAVKQAMEQAKAAALEAIGLQAEGYAKTGCPVDTGRLRNSISHACTDDTVYIGTNVEYAPYVEMGTDRMPERPFLKPAAADHAAEYKAIFEAQLRNT